MTIRIVNATFESTSAGEFETIDDAYRSAVVAGLEIAANEVRTGANGAIVEVAVLLGGQEAVARGAISVATGRFADGRPASVQ